MSGDSDSGDLPSQGEDSADFTAEILHRLEDRGETYGRYELKGEIARGGQGAILRVWDEDLRRNLAMKVVLGLGERTGDTPDVASRSLGRFLEEAQVTGQLDHPGIVPVHELGLDQEGRVYFTMKLVKGRDLRTVFKEVHEGGGPEWTQTRALNVMLKVCEAMAYAHSKGVIHRDLKPANVMVGRYGEVYVMDWGLARVQGRSDQKDLRIRKDEHVRTVELRSPRHERASATPDSPLITMDGDVVGTPAYMSPEQAVGDLDLIGPHSDVYSVGAMLYHLLAGKTPYNPDGVQMSNRVIWALVQHGPPTPLHELVPALPAELIAICEKAMDRRTNRRYADMQELAEDLRAYLENRVVRAYATGSVAELKKWMQRNKRLATAIAAGIVILVAGLTASLILKAQSDRNALLAAEREQEARDQERIAQRERENVLRLSAFQQLETLTNKAETLWPPWPGHYAAYGAWLAAARDLETSLPTHRSQLDELRARALPSTPQQLQADRREHPRFAELEALALQLADLERAQAVREGRAEPETVVLAADSLPRSVTALNDLAWALVDPDRTSFGGAARGLAMARLALERVENDEEYAAVSRTLAWALFANGLDDEAEAEASGSDVRLEQSIAGARAGTLRAEVDSLQDAIAALEVEISKHRTWRFASEEDRWWHDQLVKLVAGIEAFADPETGLIEGVSAEYGWGIELRRDWAAAIADRTVTGPRALAAWNRAIASIADLDECPVYRGLTITPQIGLMPIGRDPDSGLWEFGHPLTGDVPERGEDGRLRIEEGTGLVFVLIPGGTFAMGAQARDPFGPNYDPDARRQETPVHEVKLSPFFLSKYEMSQFQWERGAGDNPSFMRPPARYAPTLLHPVEQVSWYDAMKICARLGLELPTEAQWEYAARAGTTSIWWTGDEKESLEGAVNLADQAVARAGIPWNDVNDWPELDDGYVYHAPVDTNRPNPFGLHNVHGNLWEWCRDGFDPGFYRRSPKVDPVCPTDGWISVVNRGGAFSAEANSARSSYRNSPTPEYVSNILGLRPARELDGR